MAATFVERAVEGALVGAPMVVLQGVIISPGSLSHSRALRT
jgi:hypothetical protein